MDLDFCFREIDRKLDELQELMKLTAKGDALTLTDVCVLTGLSRNYLYRLTSERRIPYYKRGKLLYFSRDEIEDWMLKNRYATQEEIESNVSAYMITGDTKKLRRNLR